MFLLVICSSRSVNMGDASWFSRDKYPGFFVLRFEFIDNFKCICPLILREVLTKSPQTVLCFVL